MCGMGEKRSRVHNSQELEINAICMCVCVCENIRVKTTAQQNSFEAETHTHIGQPERWRRQKSGINILSIENSIDLFADTSLIAATQLNISSDD